MPALNDQQLADLLDEVGSAIEHSMPITGALERVAEQQYGSITNAARTLLTSLQQGASLEASFQKLSLSDEGQVTAAIQATRQTGNTELLSRFAETLRSRHEVRHTIKLNWFYPCILTVLAYVLFVNSLAPLVRDNEMLITQWPDAVVSASVWIEDWWWAPPCIATAIIAVVILLLLSRQRLPTAFSHSLFFSALASQLDSNVPESDAIHTAALMSGDVELLETENASFTTPRLMHLMTPHSGLFLTTLVDGSETADTPTNDSGDTTLSTISRRAHLRHLAYTNELKAQRRERLLHQILPQAVSFALGFIFILSAAWLFIAPIYSQLIQW
jgi:hypothetical protein